MIYEFVCYIIIKVPNFQKIPYKIRVFYHSIKAHLIYYITMDYSVKKISLDEAILSTEKHHSVLPKCSKSNLVRTRHLYCFGVFDSEELIASAIYTNPIARAWTTRDDMIELRRLTVHKSIQNLCTFFMAKCEKSIKKELPSIEPWNTKKRKRNDPQTTNDKIRWIKHFCMRKTKAPL